MRLLHFWEAESDVKNILDLGMELKVARTRARLSLKQLETFFNGHPTYITLHNIENDKHKPTPEHIRLVKEFIKMAPQAVLLRAKAMGIKPGKKNASRRKG